MLVILLNTSAAFTLSPELDDDLTNLLELPYEIPEDIAEFIEEAVESGRPIILMHYTPLTCNMLKELREKKSKPNAAGWTIVSFFHTDEEIQNANIGIKPDFFLQVKKRLIKYAELSIHKKN